jgi:hypothetical protein
MFAKVSRTLLSRNILGNTVTRAVNPPPPHTLHTHTHTHLSNTHLCARSCWDVRNVGHARTVAALASELLVYVPAEEERMVAALALVGAGSRRVGVGVAWELPGPGGALSGAKEGGRTACMGRLSFGRAAWSLQPAAAVASVGHVNGIYHIHHIQHRTHIRCGMAIRVGLGRL